MDDSSLLEVCADAADAVGRALLATQSWDLVHGSDAQHHSDIAADGAALGVVRKAGLAVLSEESGISGESELLAVLDPLDGSTNAKQGLPWYATSLCIMDRDGPRVALVRNLVSGVTYTAVRGGGAQRDGEPIRPSGCVRMEEAVVGLAGYPAYHLGWRQFRVYGAAALDLCAVAEGVLDGWADCSRPGHGVWDYLGGLLICQEVGATVLEVDGRDLATRDWTARRSPVAGATAELATEFRAAVVASQR